MSDAHDADLGTAAKRELGYSRWWQITAAAVMMALVSPYQYVWSSLEGPLAADLDASLSALGFVFTAYVVAMALIQFPAGWWRDRYGPRAVTLVAGVLAGGGYVALAFVTELWHVYVVYTVGAVGVGMVYTVAVNTAVKWFPDRRGLTTGIGTMAFAAGSAAFVPFIRYMVAGDALATGLWTSGALIGVGVIVGALVLADPPHGWNHPDGDVDGDSDVDADSNTDSDSDADAGSDTESDAERDGVDVDHAGTRQYTWREMLRTWQFWVMYFMFFAVSAAGLMITARTVLYAEDAGLTARTATIAATLLPVGSAGGRLIVGGLSDRFDRERITAVSFLACGLATLAIVVFAEFESGAGYVLAVAVAVFFWSSQFSLFPSLVGDYYGARHSSANYSLVYSGKMWGGVFGGGVVGWLVGVIGWDATFVGGGVLALAAGLAGFLLRPP
ncbi:OFA family oxalate/formate antiporter-like MFS transporter [Halorubrum alkaliphilum]|uniref:OFA family oxalate/formate antiporter-like MFS transporter n=1 Tax=Halorubrum alkaliphilum TaxID=261290 RepID=A0A8T4GHE4_9EURY|nr:OFA family MFS transporter [Halorubrum alkaliphilum]MBP1923918.1 OFA family oxalate/formate antiporter-like MFS transporter [Halorubrum alkaliphilum]